MDLEMDDVLQLLRDDEEKMNNLALPELKYVQILLISIDFRLQVAEKGQGKGPTKKF